MGYVLDGKTTVEIDGNTTLSDLSYGSHNLTVYATDVTGNIGASEAIHFTITNPVSQEVALFSLPVAVASAVSIAAVACIGVLLYLRKRRGSKQ